MSEMFYEGTASSSDGEPLDPRHFLIIHSLCGEIKPRGHKPHVSKAKNMDRLTGSSGVTITLFV